MLAEFFYNLKKNKWLLALFIVCAVIACLDLTVIVYDVILICLAHKNSATITKSFIALNVVAVVLSVIAIVIVFLFVKLESVKAKKFTNKIDEK